MYIFLYILIGIVGGILGGMGMGGGTLLIPLLTLFMGIEQHVAQAINLIAFIPMSIFALIIHIKNKLVKYKYLISVSLPAVAASVPASLLAAKLQGIQLSKFFGLFLTVLGIYQLVCIIVQAVKNKKKAKQE